MSRNYKFHNPDEVYLIRLKAEKNFYLNNYAGEKGILDEVIIIK